MHFDKEIKNMIKHEVNIGRPRLRKIMANVYIPKMHVKFNAPFMYHNPMQNDKRDFGTSLNDEDMVLGLSSHIDKS